MVEKTKTEVLRRYTSLPCLLDILLNKRLTLLSPHTWDDRNDRALIEAYARHHGYKACLVLCLATQSDLYHHWKVYAGGISGVCIELWKDSLLKRADENGLKHDLVTPLTVEKLRSARSDPMKYKDQLPFMKRIAFKDEREYRLIFRSLTEEITEKPFPIDLSVIRRVIVNPWASQSIFNAIQKTIEKIADGPVAVDRSEMIEHREWMEFARLYQTPADNR